MTTLTDFLLARIAEDQADAERAAPTQPWDSLAFHDLAHDDVPHVARYSPARVLAECMAKRRLVVMHSGEHECVGWKYGRWDTVFVHPDFMFRHDPTLCHLAAVYADHPDYREEWKP